MNTDGKGRVEVKRLQMLPTAEDYVAEHYAAQQSNKLSELADDYNTKVKPAAKASVKAVHEAYELLHTAIDCRYAVHDRLFASVAIQHEDAVQTMQVDTAATRELVAWLRKESGLSELDQKGWLAAIVAIKQTVIKAETELARFMAS